MILPHQSSPQLRRITCAHYCLQHHTASLLLTLTPITIYQYFFLDSHISDITFNLDQSSIFTTSASPPKPAVMYGYIRSGIDRLRDTYAPITNQSTFRNTGQITPEEFLQAGDFLVYKFPSWSWADASSPDKRVAYLPAGKQYLVTRGVPCRRRLDDNFAGDAGLEDFMVRDGEAFQGTDGADDGWLRTGGGGPAKDDESRSKDVKTVDETGEQEEDEEEIPDMEDEDDDEDAIIRDPKSEGAA